MIGKAAGTLENSKSGHQADIWAQRYNQLEKNPGGQNQEFKDFTKNAIDHKNSMAVGDGFRQLEGKRITDRNNLAASYFGGDPTVRRAQASLVLAGYDLGNHGVKGVDGQFGPKTSKAVTEYQKSIGLKPTGKLDQETMRSLDLTTEAGLKKSDIERMGKGSLSKQKLNNNNLQGEPNHSEFINEAKGLTQKFGDTSKAIKFGIERSFERSGRVSNQFL